MPKKRSSVKVTTYKVEHHYECDHCADGKMIYSNRRIDTYPPQYKHRCDKCGATGAYREIYPRTSMEYEEIEGGHEGQATKSNEECIPEAARKEDGKRLDDEHVSSSKRFKAEPEANKKEEQ